jgi:hypothetical protein
MINGIDLDWKMFLSPEMRAGVSVLEGEDPMKVAGNYATGQIMSNGVDSLGGTDALGNSQEKLFNDAGQEQLFNEAIPNPLGPQDVNIQPEAIPSSYNDAIYNPLSTPDVANSQAISPAMDKAISNPALDSNTVGLNESGIGGQGEIETPGTFLGLEGKDYTKMGMQGVLAAGVSAAQPTPIQPSKAPVGPGMTKGNPIPQGGAVGVNSMVNPVQPLNSMQMTQAQGLISPFQRDRMRRGQY